MAIVYIAPDNVIVLSLTVWVNHSSRISGSNGRVMCNRMQRRKFCHSVDKDGMLRFPANCCLFHPRSSPGYEPATSILRVRIW